MEAGAEDGAGEEAVLGGGAAGPMVGQGVPFPGKGGSGVRGSPGWPGIKVTISWSPASSGEEGRRERGQSTRIVLR